MTDISKDEVQRYSVKPWDIRRADIVRDDDGSLVSYDDYRAQSARIEHLEAAIKRQASAALSALPPQDVSVHEAAKVLLSGKGENYWRAFSAMDSRMDESPEAAFYAALRALSEKPNE